MEGRRCRYMAGLVCGNLEDITKCFLKGQLDTQSQNGRHASRNPAIKGAGPFWPTNEWVGYTKRTNQHAANTGCAFAKELITEGDRITDEKRKNGELL